MENNFGPNEENKLSQLVKEIEDCKYECNAGPLENHLAFIQLKHNILDIEADPAEELIDADVTEYLQKESAEEGVFLSLESALLFTDIFYRFLHEKGWLVTDVSSE